MSNFQMSSIPAQTYSPPPIVNFLATVLDVYLQKQQFQVFWWFSKAEW